MRSTRIIQYPCTTKATLLLLLRSPLHFHSQFLANDAHTLTWRCCCGAETGRHWFQNNFCIRRWRFFQVYPERNEDKEFRFFALLTLHFSNCGTPLATVTKRISLYLWHISQFFIRHSSLPLFLSPPSLLLLFLRTELNSYFDSHETREEHATHSVYSHRTQRHTPRTDSINRN